MGAARNYRTMTQFSSLGIALLEDFESLDGLDDCQGLMQANRPSSFIATLRQS
jgi:hypothetical protein